MDNHLFFVQDGLATEMNERFYEKEEHLQKLVEDNPNLIARAWDGSDCRLFLIKRELDVPSSEQNPIHFSIDHLLVGEDAVPVIVEVKRSSDTRIRREVVGQMFDYACRASTWDVEQLREMFDANNGREVVEEISTDDFWDSVQANLQAERMRLVFVADQIPDTLQAMIKFLDRKLDGVEVYGVEIRQYETQNATLLSSSVIGNNPIETPKKAYVRGFRNWDDASFTEYLHERRLDDTIPVMKALLRFAEESGLSCVYGHGAKGPSFAVKLGKQTLFLVEGWWKSAGYLATVTFWIHQLASKVNYDEEQLRLFLMDLPEKDRAEQEELIWNTPNQLYINLTYLANDAGMKKFQQNIEKLKDATKTVTATWGDSHS